MNEICAAYAEHPERWPPGDHSLTTKPPRQRRLRRSFFDRPVTEVARDLIGATFLAGQAGGVITEVEAYHDTEAAAHSFGGMTTRNAVMFGQAGHVYVYRSYGLHWCVNFVCEAEGSASAVLLRAIEPTSGLALMRRRRGMDDVRLLCSGPGRLTQAIGITHAHNGLPVDAPPFTLLGRPVEPEILAGPRIGITKAVDLPWRYGLKGSRFLSRPFKA